MGIDIIPAQLKGDSVDLFSEKLYASIEEAKIAYSLAKEKLSAVNNWEEICGTSATFFKLTDDRGVDSAQLAVGSLIRIDIPGPGTGAGDGYDWVCVEKMDSQTEKERVEWFGFTVRPCPNPKNPSSGTAHFFSEAATSTFIVKRVDLKIVAEMHGRNEIPNKACEGIFDGLRNAMVGYSAKIGVSYPQWQLLLDGVVELEK